MKVFKWNSPYGPPENLRRKQLIEFCQKNGIKKYSRKRNSQIVELIKAEEEQRRKEDTVAVEKEQERRIIIEKRSTKSFYFPGRAWKNIVSFCNGMLNCIEINTKVEFKENYMRLYEYILYEKLVEWLNKSSQNKRNLCKSISIHFFKFNHHYRNHYGYRFCARHSRPNCIMRIEDMGVIMNDEWGFEEYNSQYKKYYGRSNRAVNPLLEWMFCHMQNVIEIVNFATELSHDYIILGDDIQKKMRRYYKFKRKSDYKHLPIYKKYNKYFNNVPVTYDKLRNLITKYWERLVKEWEKLAMSEEEWVKIEEEWVQENGEF